jgi:microcompartment protein CcmL/EutN
MSSDSPHIAVRKGQEEKMAENYNGKAVGVFEMDNLVACFVALDTASKTAGITVQGVERNRLKSGACVKIRGSVSDVKAAMEAGIAAGSWYGTLTASTVIPSPTEDTETALQMTINK